MSAGFTSVRVVLFCLVWTPTSPREQRTNPPRLGTPFMEFSKVGSPFLVNLYWDLWEDRGERDYEGLQWRNASCPTTSTVELLMLFLTKAPPWMTRALAIRHVTTLKSIFPLFFRQLGLSYSWISKDLNLYWDISLLVCWVFLASNLFSIQISNAIWTLCPRWWLAFSETAKF